MNSKKSVILVVALLLMLVACSPQASEPVEVTRIVETIVEKINDVEVTRIVEVPVEVTRLVKQEVPVTRIVEQVVVATSTPVPPTATPDTPNVGERDNPVPLGQPQGMWIRNDDERIEFDLTMLEAQRGEEAWTTISNDSSYNDPPKDGNEYVIVKARVDYTGEDKGILEISWADMNIVSGGNIYDPWDGVEITHVDPQFDFELLAGGSAEGWFGWQIPIADDTAVYIGDVFYAIE